MKPVALKAQVTSLFSVYDWFSDDRRRTPRRCVYVAIRLFPSACSVGCVWTQLGCNKVYRSPPKPKNCSQPPTFHSYSEFMVLRQKECLCFVTLFYIFAELALADVPTPNAATIFFRTFQTSIVSSGQNSSVDGPA